MACTDRFPSTERTQEFLDGFSAIESVLQSPDGAKLVPSASDCVVTPWR